MQPLVAALDDSDEGVREAVARALRDHRHPGAVEPLGHVVQVGLKALHLPVKTMDLLPGIGQFLFQGLPGRFGLGILPGLGRKVRNRGERNRLISERAVTAMKGFVGEQPWFFATP